MGDKKNFKLVLDKTSLIKNQKINERITRFLDPNINLSEELNSIGITNNFWK